MRGYVVRGNQCNVEKGLNVASKHGIHTSQRRAAEVKGGKRAGKEEAGGKERSEAGSGKQET